MKHVLCTEFQVNRMNCVDPSPPLKASCNYFFYKASRVKVVQFYTFQVTVSQGIFSKFSDELSPTTNQLKEVHLSSPPLPPPLLGYTVEPWFNDLQNDDIPGLTVNIHLLSKSYSKMYGAEPQYNNLRYNNIPGLTMGMLLTKHKIFLNITIKSISQTSGNAITVTKQTFITLTIILTFLYF